MEVELEQHIRAVADKLRQMRKEKGFSSYRHFADEHEIPQHSYLEMETGKTDFRQGSLLRILKAHNVSLKDFINSL